MRPSECRLPYRTSRFSLACLALLVFAATQSSPGQRLEESFHFPDKGELRPTHEGKPITGIGLTESEINELTQTIWDSGTIEPALPSDYEMRDELLARRFDFGDGQQNGLVLQATKKFCDTLGNCRTWFFQKEDGRWQSLADQRTPNAGVRVFDFAVQKPSATNEAASLILVTHSAADNYPTRVWELEGGKYAAKKFFCWHRESNSFETKPCVDFQPPGKMRGTHQSAGISEGDLDNETVAALIAMTVGKRDADEEMLGDKDPEEELIAMHLDLGEGVEKGLVVQGGEKLCGATGNCAMWFFRKIGDKWKSLQFEEGEGGTLASMFEAVPPKHNGLFELILGSHFNAFEVPFAQLWFDGQKYVLHQTYCEYSDTGKVLAGDCE
ncbi:MAG TPA: hypothetical protein VFO34_09735 [Candidatus Acidoferrales bacterium]|nr:hypothetical protein [Candidatus Acidoferrales bacterium]